MPSRLREQRSPISWMLGVVLFVFMIMLIWSDGERIRHMNEKHELLEKAYLLQQRMNLLAVRMDLMKMMADEERERLLYPPARDFPTSEDLRKKPLKVPTDTAAIDADEEGE